MPSPPSPAASHLRKPSEAKATLIVRPLFSPLFPLAPFSHSLTPLLDLARVEISFLLNPQAYHGALRIATGLAIVQGLIDLAPRANEIHLPIKAIHGAQVGSLNLPISLISLIFLIFLNLLCALLGPHHQSSRN